MFFNIDPPISNKKTLFPVFSEFCNFNGEKLAKGYVADVSRECSTIFNYMKKEKNVSKAGNPPLRKVSFNDC